MSETRQQDILEHIINDFSRAMMVSLDGNGQPHARPMGIAGFDRDGWKLSFLTRADSPKVDEVQSAPRGMVTLQSSSQYAALTGGFTVFKDPSRVKALWSKPFEAWFPDGPEDPAIRIIEFAIASGEYWDTSGLKKLEFVVDFAKALMTDSKVPVREPEHHGVVGL